MQIFARSGVRWKDEIATTKMYSRVTWTLPRLANPQNRFQPT
jgi:hypothetical protein